MITSLLCKVCCTEKDISNFRLKIVRGKTYYEKTCRECEAIKAKEYYHSHKKERAEYQKAYISNNKEIIKEKKKIYDKNNYEENREEKLEYAKDWAKNNRDKVNYNKRERRKNDPAFRLRYYISNRIRKILKQNGDKKNNSSLKYLNYSFEELKNYVEKQFESWMTWDNWGLYDSASWNDDDSKTWTWNIDHIIPQSDLPYTSMEDENFKKCWSLDNLRPLSSKRNVIEGTSRVRHVK